MTHHLLRPWRALRARPRLAASAAVGALVYAALPAAWVTQPVTRALLAWNGFALLYLALAWQMARGAAPETMRRRALTQDEGRHFILALVVAAVAAAVVAIATQLAAVKGLPALAQGHHVALAALTLVTAWGFMQVLFAMHYAHDFYMGRVRGQPDALVFPGTPDPDYRDFLYFACVIGTSGQTADVVFQGRALRGLGALHCVLAFFFNATVLALTINFGANLL